VRLRYLVLKRANRLPEKVDRPLLALGKICACFMSFLSLLRVPRLLASWFADGAANRGICHKGAVIERRRAIVPHVCGRALSKCRGQGFVDGRFEGDDFGDAKSLLHFLGIESLKVTDALLKLPDPTPLLFDSEDRCFGLAGLGRPGAADGTTGHAVSLEYSGDDNHGIKAHDVFIARPALD
jgi:hypothetical protein